MWLPWRDCVVVVRCHDHMPHGTSQLHISVRSLRFLIHYLGPVALGSVNHVETYTSLCNLYLTHVLVDQYVRTTISDDLFLFSIPIPVSVYIFCVFQLPILLRMLFLEDRCKETTAKIMYRFFDACLKYA